MHHWDREVNGANQHVMFDAKGPSIQECREEKCQSDIEVSGEIEINTPNLHDGEKEQRKQYGRGQLIDRFKFLNPHMSL